MSIKSTNPGRDALANDLLTIEDLVIILKVSKSTVRRWGKAGFLPVTPFGATNYYSLKALKKTIRQRTHPFYNRKNDLNDLDSAHKKDQE